MGYHMDKDPIYKIFQEICRKIPVVILGSGPSCAAGIPGMRSLAEHLLDKFRNDTSEDWRKISDDLRKNIDLETALNKTSPDENLIKEMRAKVKSGEIDAQTAANTIGKVCLCGCFNPHVAATLLS